MSISPYGLFTSPLSINFKYSDKVKEEKLSLSQQLDSGGKVGKYSEKHIHDVKTLIKVESEPEALKTQKLNVEGLINRQEFISKQIEEARKINEEFKQLLIQIQSPFPPLQVSYNDQLKSFLTNLTSILNMQYMDKSIFGGSREGYNAVKNLTELGSLDVDSEPSIDDYIEWDGIVNESRQISQLDEMHTIDRFSVDASHASFSKTICAIRIVMSANLSDASDSDAVADFNRIIEKSSAMIDSASQDYNQAALISGINERILENSLEFIEAKEKNNRSEIDRLIDAQRLENVLYTLKELEVTERVLEYISSNEIRKMNEFLERN